MADRKQFNGVVSFKNTANFDGQITQSVGAGDISVEGATLNDNGLPFLLLGLNPHMVHNFGEAGVKDFITHSTTSQVGDVKTPVNDLLKMSIALAGVASQTDVVSAAQASQIFASNGAAGTDVAIGTNASPGTTPLTNLKVHRLTGNVSGENVSMAAGASISHNHQTLILFTGNTITHSHILQLETATGEGLGAAYTEAVVSGAGNGSLTREGSPTDDDEKIKLTATHPSAGSNAVTILPGSFIYLYRKDNDASGFAMKSCIRTSGGTIAVTYAA